MDDLKREQRRTAIIQELIDKGKQRSTEMTESLHEMVDLIEGMPLFYSTLPFSSMMTKKEVAGLERTAIMCSAMAITISRYLAHPKATDDMHMLVDDLNRSFIILAGIYVEALNTGEQA